MPPGLAVPGIGDGRALDVEADLHRAGRHPAGRHGDPAFVGARPGVPWDLDAEPEGLDLSFGNVHFFLEGPADPVDSRDLEAAEGPGGEAFSRGIEESGTPDIQGLEADEAGVDSHLEGVELPLAGGVFQGSPGSAPRPPEGDVPVHADRVFAVLPEEQEGGAGVLGEQGVHFLRGGGDLHGGEGVEGAPGFEGDDPGRGKFLEAGRAGCEPLQAVPADPGGVRLFFWLQVFHLGVVPGTGGPEGEIIEQVFPRPFGGPEDQDSLLAARLEDQEVPDPFARPGGKEEHRLGGGIGVAAPPGKGDPEGWARLGDQDPGPVVAQAFGLPGGGSPGDLSGGSRGGRGVHEDRE